MPPPQPPRVTGPLSKKKGANSGSGGNNRGAGNPSNPAPNITSQPGSPCLISFPSAGLPLVGSVGGGCLLSKTNVRAMVGGLLIGTGGILFLGGIAVVVAAGFKKTGALDKVAAGVAFVPGAGPVAAAGIRSAGSPSRRRSEGAARDARMERQLGQPRENRNLREGRGAVRETPAATRRRRTERDQEPPF